MLDKVKLALRLSGTALDGEVSDLINAAIADLRLVGINIPAEAGSSSKTLGDPLLDRAVVLYAKAEFGFNDDAERYRNAYDYLNDDRSSDPANHKRHCKRADRQHRPNHYGGRSAFRGAHSEFADDHS